MLKYYRDYAKKFCLLMLVFIQVLASQSCKEQSINEKAESSQSSDENYSKEALLRQDEKSNCAHGLNLIKKEIEVEKLLDTLRSQFINENGKGQFFKKPFHEVQSDIQSSSLFQLLQLMPKGGLLHCHSGGITDVRWVLSTARNIPECYVFLEKNSEEFLYGQLSIFKPGQVKKGFVSLSSALERKKDLNQKLIALYTLKEFDVDNHSDVWEAFEKRFMRISNLWAYRPFFKQYYEQAFLDLIEDGVSHVEIRFIMEELYDLEKSYPVETIIKDLQEIVSKVKEKSPKFSMNLIYTSFKFFDVETINEQLELAYELKKNYPTLITGFDLVAQEKDGNRIAYFDESWKKRDTLTKKYGFELPLYLHAGESRSVANKNLYDAVLLGTKRIGHGLNLSYYPSLVDKVIEKDILLEISPLSNKILGYVPDLGNHPVRTLMARGVQCSISSDDPSVFGYKGMSYDYFMAYVAWELNLSELKKLLFNSIEYSGLLESERDKALSNLKKDWDAFIEETYSSL